MTRAAERLIAALRAQHRSIAVAESLTGGLVTDAIVSVPGASSVLRGGVTAYQVPVKVSLLGVAEQVIASDGVVSPAVAIAMAQGACRLFGAEIGIGTTGVAGPGPCDGVAAGQVVVAVARSAREEAAARVWVRQWHLAGGRVAIRRATASLALALACSALDDDGEQGEQTGGERRWSQ